MTTEWENTTQEHLHPPCTFISITLFPWFSGWGEGGQLQGLLGITLVTLCWQHTCRSAWHVGCCSWVFLSPNLSPPFKFLVHLGTKQNHRAGEGWPGAGSLHHTAACFSFVLSCLYHFLWQTVWPFDRLSLLATLQIGFPGSVLPLRFLSACSVPTHLKPLTPLMWMALLSGSKLSLVPLPPGLWILLFGGLLAPQLPPLFPRAAPSLMAPWLKTSTPSPTHSHFNHFPFATIQVQTFSPRLTP